MPGRSLGSIEPAAVAVTAVPAAVTPDYWDDACRHLSKRDRVMKKLIPRFGQARLQSRGDAFTTLARSIVGQQISVKAAQSVWDRFVAVVGGPAVHLQPSAVLARDTPELRGAGLSARKVEYLGDLARHFESDALHVLPLDDLGLIKGISQGYFSGEPVSRAEAREVGEAWVPFRSVATWYIWRSLDPLPVDY